MVVASTDQSSKSSRGISIWKGLRLGMPLMVMLLVSSGLGKQVITTVITTLQPKSPNVITQPVERKTIPITVTANGTVEALRSINLSPKSSGVVKQLLVQEGDRVRQGQILATMDDSNLQGQLTQMRGQLAQQEANLSRILAGNRPEDIAKAEAQLAEAQANLQQLRTGNRAQEIAQAKAQLQQAQATLNLRQQDLQRYQQLYDEGAIAQQTSDQKHSERDVAQAQVQSALQALGLQQSGTRPEQIAQAEARVRQQEQTVLALKVGSRPEEIAQARAQVEAARGSLQTTLAQLQDLQVKAPFAGVVTHIAAELGSFVSPSMAGGSGTSASASILTLASDRNQIVTNFSESQIRQIKPSQSVKITADAFPGETFLGQIKTIAPQASVSQNVTSFAVKVAIADNAARLKPGMNVEVTVAIGQLKNSLVVPNAALVRQTDAQGVYVLQADEKVVFKPVQTGMTIQGKTQVKAGLQGNEKILLSPPNEAKKSGGLRFPPAP